MEVGYSSMCEINRSLVFYKKVLMVLTGKIVLISVSNPKILNSVLNTSFVLVSVKLWYTVTIIRPPLPMYILVCLFRALSFYNR